jgi:hypothetical protein
MELDMHAWPPLQGIHVASLSREGTHNSIQLKPPRSLDEKPYMACGWTINGSSTQQPWWWGWMHTIYIPKATNEPFPFVESLKETCTFNIYMARGVLQLNRPQACLGRREESGGGECGWRLKMQPFRINEIRACFRIQFSTSATKKLVNIVVTTYLMPKVSETNVRWGVLNSGGTRSREKRQSLVGCWFI